MNTKQYVGIIIFAIVLICINTLMFTGLQTALEQEGEIVECYDKHNNVILNQECYDEGGQEIYDIIFIWIFCNVGLFFAFIPVYGVFLDDGRYY